MIRISLLCGAVVGFPLMLAMGLSSPSDAADKTFAVQAPAGTYILVIGSNGEAKLSPLQVIRPTGTTPPVSEPDPIKPEPQDPKLQKLGDSLKGMVLTPSMSERQSFARLLRDTAGMNLGYNLMQSVIRDLFSTAAANSADPEFWASWKELVDTAVVDAGISGRDEYVKALNLIASHLEGS